MLTLLRLIGIGNAATWFGASMAFLCVWNSGLHSEAMRAILPDGYVGAVHLTLLDSHLQLLIGCGFLALIVLGLEHWYVGQLYTRLRVYLILVLLASSFFTHWVVVPRMRHYHIQSFHPDTSQSLRTSAMSRYRTWKTGFHFFHLLIAIGSFSHLWHCTPRPNRYHSYGR